MEAKPATITAQGVIIEKDGTRKEFTQTFEVKSHGSNAPNSNA
jgi:hypothetical protein